MLRGQGEGSQEDPRHDPSEVRAAPMTTRVRGSLLKVVAAASAVCLQVGVVEASARPPLTMEDRVRAQRLVEEVKWRYRIWPSENREAKPEFASVYDDGRARGAVEDTLRKSAALARVWSRRITGAEIEAELRRMAGATRAPDQLRAMFEALGNDPDLIAEGLVFPLLVERRIREAYATDERLHRNVRGRAEAVAVGASTLDGLAIAASGGEWQASESKVAAVPTVPRLVETGDAFVAHGQARLRDGTVGSGIAVWRKREFDSWWNEERGRYSATSPPAGEPGTASVTLPAVATACTDDTWDYIRWSAPVPRYAHIVVWTGTEMIVWGGEDGSTPETITGGRYDPATDNWTPMSLVFETEPGLYATGVWSGTEVIIWGGYSSFGGGPGARYNPTTDKWSPIRSDATAPPIR